MKRTYEYVEVTKNNNRESGGEKSKPEAKVIKRHERVSWNLIEDSKQGVKPEAMYYIHFEEL